MLIQSLKRHINVTPRCTSARLVASGSMQKQTSGAINWTTNTIAPGCDIGIYQTCSVCGKRFYIRNPESWTYKRFVSGEKGKRKYFCSYSCSTNFQKKRSAEIQEKLKASKVKGLEDYITEPLLDRLFWEEGKTLAEISKELKVSRSTIDKYMNLYAISYKGNGRKRPPKRMPRRNRDD